jgi:hypothetical protein
MDIKRVVSILTFAVMTAACGSLLGPITSEPPPAPGVSTTTDPTGDAGPSPTFDAVELRTDRGTSSIQVRLWTVPDPILPSPGFLPSFSQLSGGIGFNTDLNGATGTSFVAPCGAGQGIDRFIDLTARNADGTYSMLDASLAVTGTASVATDGPRVVFTASFGALGTATGRMQVNAITGVGVFSARDCIPDAGQSLPSRAPSGRHRLLAD